MDTYIKDTAIWTDKIRQIEVNHRVLGGNEEPANWQAQGLANRTAFLKQLVEALGHDKVNQSDYDAAIRALQKQDSEFYKAIQGLTQKDTNLDAAIKALQQQDIKFSSEIYTLARWIQLAKPVGILAQSMNPYGFNDYWVPLEGDWFSRNEASMLYDYYAALGYPVSSQNTMRLLDARALVFRNTNKGRFSDVEETGIGKYQEDATQRVQATFGDFWVGRNHVANGALSQSAHHTALEVTMGGNYLGYANSYDFDNARAARIALENRVKALGVTAVQWKGFDFNYEVPK